MLHRCLIGPLPKQEHPRRPLSHMQDTCAARWQTHSAQHACFTLDLRLGGVYFLQHWDAEGCCLACAVLGPSQDITACQGDGDAFFLNGGGLFKALLVDAHQELPLQEIVLEIVALGGGHVLQKGRRGSDNPLARLVTT